MNVDLRIVVTNLWPSDKSVSLMIVFWRQFGLSMSITSKWVPFLFLKQILSLTELVHANTSLRLEKWFLVSLNSSKWLMFKFPVTCFFYKQSKFRKQSGACLWKKLVQAQRMLALCLFIKILLGVCLRKRLDQAHNALFY